MSGPLGFVYEGAVLIFMVISVSQCKCMKNSWLLCFNTNLDSLVFRSVSSS